MEAINQWTVEEILSGSTWSFWVPERKELLQTTTWYEDFLFNKKQPQTKDNCVLHMFEMDIHQIESKQRVLDEDSKRDWWTTEMLKETWKSVAVDEMVPSVVQFMPVWTHYILGKDYWVSHDDDFPRMDQIPDNGSLDPTTYCSMTQPTAPRNTHQRSRVSVHTDTERSDEQRRSTTVVSCLQEVETIEIPLTGYGRFGRGVKVDSQYLEKYVIEIGQEVDATCDLTKCLLDRKCPLKKWESTKTSTTEALLVTGSHCSNSENKNDHRRKKDNNTQKNKTTSNRYKQEDGNNQGNQPSTNPSAGGLKEPSSGAHLRVYGKNLTMKDLYTYLNQAKMKCNFFRKSDNFRVERMQKINQEKCFKVTDKNGNGSEVTQKVFVRSLGQLGKKYHFRVKVFRSNPHPNMGKELKFDSRRKWKIATYNVGTLNDKRTQLIGFLSEENVDVLGIQETRRTTDMESIHIPNYEVYESKPEKIDRGNLGIALFVHKNLKSELIDNTENMIWVRASRSNKSFIVCNVYIPTANANGKQSEIKKELKNKIKAYCEQEENCNLIILGDFNMRPSILKNWIRSIGVPLETVKLDENAITFRGQNGSVIDYILYKGPNLYFSSGSISNEFEISDHNALLATVEYYSNVRREVVKQVNRTAVLKDLKDDIDDKVFNSEYLEELTSTEDSDKVMEFINELKKVLEAKGMMRTPKERGERKMIFPRNLRKMTVHKRELQKKKREGIQLTEDENEWIKKCKKLIAEFEEELRLKEIRWGIDAITHKDLKQMWNWIDYRVNGKDRKAMIIRDPESGKYESNPKKVAKLWASHYKRLGSKGEGHSKNPIYWKDQPVFKPENQEMCGNEEYWNREIEWYEIQSAVKKLKNGKAAGIDEIPGEVYKAIVKIEYPRDNKGLAYILLKVINILFNGDIPKELMTSIVVSVPKKGDLTDMNNYRGISLMPVCVKIVAAIVAQRISNAFEEEHFLVDSQAGFRTDQECVGQVGALLEIIQRWTKKQTKSKLRGDIEELLRAYVCFIDFKKAYDMVPHEAMLYKLRIYGIVGKTYEFIRTLYAKSKINVRVEDVYSPSVPLERGLRQGCPLSPILFSIFINDILRKPTIQRREWEPKVESLMFADDIVVFAKSGERLQELLDEITEWSDRWEMKIGHAKCGVMLFGKDISEEDRNRKWILQGGEISVVDKYTYLGLQITPELDEKVMEDGRLELGKMALGRIQKFLLDYHVPATIRVKVLESIVQATCIYGAEVWGGDIKDCSKVQTILNEGMRYITQGKRMNATSTSVMQLELDLCPIYPVIVKKRMRVGWKGNRMSVTLGDLIESKTSWHSSVSTYLRKTKRIGIFQMKQYDKASDKDKLREEQKERIKNKYNPEKVFWNKKNDRFLDDLIPFLWCKQLETDYCQSLWNYLHSGRAMNRMYMNVWFKKPEWARGCQVILNMRVGCWYPGERIVPYEDNVLQMSCPCCGKQGKETLKHYLVE